MLSDLIVSGLKTAGSSFIPSLKKKYFDHPKIYFVFKLNGARQFSGALSNRNPSVPVVSEAIYLDDPDKNGVELYWDKPKEQWLRDEEGNLQMLTEALDVEDLLRLAV